MTSAGWLHLLALIEEATTDQRAEFKPFVELSAAERRQIITLPPTIANLTSVRRLVLYGTNLVRIPPEIGAMTSLETFQPYTSHRLHWYPFELTRCQQLKDSGQHAGAVRQLQVPAAIPSPPADHRRARSRPALDPHVWGTEAVRTCSVCDGPVDRELRQAWISLRVGTDVLPLLVNACSAACVAALPPPYDGYIPTPHTGGPHIVQPTGRR